MIYHDDAQMALTCSGDEKQFTSAPNQSVRNALELSRGNLLLTHPISPIVAASRCPTCHSIIYSRRHQLCGVCGRPLPEQCLFPVSEALRIQGLLTTEKQRHRQWLARASV